MGEDKKDLTNLMEYSKAMQEAGKAPPVPAGSIMEEQKIDKIDDFESLEEYSKSNPAAEPPPEAPSEPEPAAPAAASAPSADSPPVQEFATQDFPVSDGAPPSTSAMDFSGGSSSEIAGIPGLEGETSADPSGGMPPVDFKPETDLSAAITGAMDASGADADGLAQQRIENQAYSSPESLTATGALPDAPAAQSEPASDAMSASGSDAMSMSMPTSEAPVASVAAPPQSPPPPQREPTQSFTPPTPSGPVSSSVQIAAGAENEAASASGTDPFLSAPPHSPQRARKPVDQPALDRLKQYSEHLNPGKASVPAAFPFSLLIDGPLSPEEREKLLDVLSRENLGIREVDLEPQFESGKVLIPRISEYAGVVLVQALRAARARMRLGPSDSIFSTADTRDTEADDFETAGADHEESMTADLGHPAESIPVTTDSQLPGMLSATVVDVVTASASLKSEVVEAESSGEYQSVLEGLQREIKYKAYRKGATAVVNFRIQLQPLTLPTHYRMMVTGSAVRPHAPDPAPPQPQP